MKTRLLMIVTIASLSEAFTLQHPRSFPSSRVVAAASGRRRSTESSAISAAATTNSGAKFTSDRISKNQRVNDVSLSSSSTVANEDNNNNLSEKLTPIGISAWFAGIGYFIFRNYKIGPWIPVTLSKQTWVFLHATCNMFFSGGIVLSTVLEWRIVTNTNPEVVKFWFTRVSNIDKWVVLPALTLSIIAGFAQTALDYGSMKSAPKHIRRAIHILATFGLWWIATDLTTQRAAKTSVLQWYKKASKGRRVGLPKVLFLRRASNVVSCLFVGALYALMALKPWYSP